MSQDKKVQQGVPEETFLCLTRYELSMYGGAVGVTAVGKISLFFPGPSTMQHIWKEHMHGVLMA